MNILEVEDMIKGLPDQALQQEAQAPTGQVPQFLVISEIQRRTDMRKRFQQEQQPQGTVADQIVQEGVMGVMPPQAMPPQGMPPQQMFSGGIIRLQEGGVARMAEGGETSRAKALMDILAVGGVTVPDLLARGYTTAEISAAQNQLKQRMSMPVIGADSALSAKEISDPTRDSEVGYGDQYDPPLIPGVTDVIADKFSEAKDAAAKGIRSLATSAKENMPDYGMIMPSGLGFEMPSIPMPERTSQEELAQMIGADEIERRLANRPTLSDALSGISSMFSSDASVQGESPIQAQAVSKEDEGDPILTNIPSKETVDPYMPDRVLGNAPVKGDAAQQDAPDAIKDALDLLTTTAGPDASNPKSKPSLDLSDLIADSKRAGMANALMQLGAGIAGGDLSKGISAAGVAATKGQQDAKAIAIRKRLAEYQAGREDIARAEKGRQFDRQMKALETRYANELVKSASVGRNELFRTVTSLVEAAMEGSTEFDPAAREAMVQAMMKKYLAAYAPAFDVDPETVSFGMKEDQGSSQSQQGWGIAGR